MKLASYKGRRKGFTGIFNVLIRFWLMGKHSHSEVIFEPGDGVDHLMPDGTTESATLDSVLPKTMPRGIVVNTALGKGA